ncbi:MAG TPA: polysaccharide deacetylase family protein [Bacteroidales bacterium]|nr:polysaccharide deacetylase family protein [Bacteroidales bacterium]
MHSRMYLATMPYILRTFLPSNVTWEIATDKKEIFITFDDGPIPEVTPGVLKILDEFNAKATFFCVGDNVRKHPEEFKLVKSKGHSLGNHTFNHLRGWATSQQRYHENVNKCNDLVQSPLFRPPHGQLTPLMARQLHANYRIVMWSVLSMDFDRSVSPYKCLQHSIKHTGNGSIIVFHDSLKARERMEYVLPRYLEHFSKEGYTFSALNGQLKH